MNAKQQTSGAHVLIKALFGLATLFLGFAAYHTPESSDKLKLLLAWAFAASVVAGYIWRPRLFHGSNFYNNIKNEKIKTAWQTTAPVIMRITGCGALLCFSFLAVDFLNYSFRQTTGMVLIYEIIYSLLFLGAGAGVFLALWLADAKSMLKNKNLIFIHPAGKNGFRLAAGCFLLLIFLAVADFLAKLLGINLG